MEEQEREESADVSSEPTQQLQNIGGSNWMSTDLTNGKALCCLIHHYHPKLLPREELRLSNTVMDGPPTKIDTSQAMLPPPQRNRFRHMRRHRLKPKVAPDYHLRLAHRRLSELGGIPPMMIMPFTTHGKHHKHTTVAPLEEEKSMLVFLYHTCARLLESRHQVQAVEYVQQRYRYLRWLRVQKRKQRASQVIWKCWLKNKSNYFHAREQKYKSSVQIIEAFTARNFDKLLLLQEKRLERDLQNLAATPIQVRS